MRPDRFDIRHLLPQIVPTPSEQRTRDHRCGKCQWGGTGSTSCPNYRAAQATPYQEPDDAV